MKNNPSILPETGLRTSTIYFFVLCIIGLLLGGRFLQAQNIVTVVAPGGSVDIQNNTGNRWYFFSAPTPSGASMAKVSSNLVAVDTWPTPGNFAADPTNNVQNRIFQGEYLRVYAGSLPINSVITIPYSTPLPGSGSYTFSITVANAPYVTAINIIDPSPTVALSVRWSVTFSAAISNVTAANFILTNPNGLSGSTITSVTGSGTNWTVTATTGTGTGLLGCSYIGHASESPIVPATFTGQQYTFSPYPLITTDPVSANIPTGGNTTLSVTATLRGGGSINYQWYQGTSTNPGAATLIGGATSASYVVSGIPAGTSRQYFCRALSAANTAYTADSTTATVTTLTPVSITSQPAGSTVAAGQTVTLSVGVTGTSPQFQWYLGNAGNTSTPVGTNSASYTTPSLSTNSSYWVLISNALPASYNQSSGTASIRVVTTLTGNGPLVALINDSFVPAPSYTVRDSAGAIVSNFPVTFTVNGNSASGNLGGQTTRIVNSDGSGIATTALTANATAGTYTVTATAGSNVSSVINLKNVAQLTVNTATDEDNGSIDPLLGSGLSLREAVSYAVAHGGSPTINFNASLAGQTVVLNRGWTGSGDSSALTISNVNLTIQGLTSSPGITLGITGTPRRHFYVNGGASLTLTDLTLRDGTAPDFGGAVWSFGSFTARRCTFNNNSAANEGGAIQSWGASLLFRLENCTIAGNSSPVGSALSIGALAASLDHCTIADNTGANGSLLIYQTSVTMRDSLFARNANDNAYINGNGTGNFSTSSSNNLLGNGTWPGLTNGVNGNQLGVSNPGLGTLANNGGPTPTLALLSGSPAVNRGTSLAGITTDQRGKLRPQFGVTDIGAVEQTPFDTTQNIITVGGAYWYLAPDLVGNDHRIFREIPGQTPVEAGGLATEIGYAIDGSVLVRNFGGGVFLRVGSLTGTGTGYQLLTGVTAGDGANWFLENTGLNSDFYISRWAAGGSPAYTGGLGISLAVQANGSITTGVSNGGTWLRLGSQSGIGSSWIYLNAISLWRVTHSLALDGSQDLANPSGDGVANLLKYAFNLSPNSGDLLKPNIAVLPANGTSGLPCYTRDGTGRLVIEFIRRKTATTPGITYNVESTTDFSTWQTLNLASATVASIDTTWERVTVTTPTIDPARFGRVRITLAP